MKVLVNTFGTGGDVTPLLAIAREIAGLGHEVLLALDPACEEQARATGLPYAPAGPRWSVDELANLERYLDPNFGGIRIWKDIWVPRIAPTYRDLRALLDREHVDVVLAHFLAVAAQWAARDAKVPCAIATLAPCWWFSRERPPIFSPSVPPAWLHPHILWIPRMMFDHTISKPLAPVCAELGRPFRKDEYFRIFQEADVSLAMWSPALRAPAGDDPAGTLLCGFPFSSAAPEIALEPRIEAFLEAGPPPVVVGLGTSVRNLGDKVLRNVARSCTELGRRALLVGQEMEGLPDSALAVRAVPYSAVFPRAELVIHHGGIGTLSEAWRAGRPSIIAPFASDQFDNALLSERAGMSRTVSRAKLFGRGLTKVLREALESQGMRERAAQMGEALKKEPPGAKVAAEALVQRSVKAA